MRGIPSQFAIETNALSGKSCGRLYDVVMVGKLLFHFPLHCINQNAQQNELLHCFETPLYGGFIENGWKMRNCILLYDKSGTQIE